MHNQSLMMLILAIFLVSCAKKEVPENILVLKNEIIYEAGVSQPFTGVSLNYYKEGNLKTKSSYKNGFLDGLVTTYREDGAILSLTNYRKGKENGVKEIFESMPSWEDYIHSRKKDVAKKSEPRLYETDGITVLVEKTIYKDGRRQGFSEDYWSVRELRDEGPSVIGIPNFGRHGKKQSSGMYENGRKEGAWNFYYDNGAKPNIKRYENGRLNGRAEVYSFDRSADESWLFKESLYKSGFKSGEEKTYMRDYDGTGSWLYEKNEYVQGKKVFSEDYYRSGRVKYRARSVDNKWVVEVQWGAKKNSK